MREVGIEGLRPWFTGIILKPLTDVASKWAFLVVIYSLQGVPCSCGELLQLKQHVATIYLQ